MYVNTHYIVVEDPTGQYWEGSLVDGARANHLGQKGVVLLPVVPDLFPLSGVAGYAKRSWGAGLPLGFESPKHVAPLTMFLANVQDSGRQVCNVIRWACRLQIEDEAVDSYLKAGGKLQGSLRLVPDGNQRCTHRLGMSQKESPVELGNLGPHDARGGWVIGGTTSASFAVDSHYGFCIYGRAPGLRVVWVAASLAY